MTVLYSPTAYAKYSNLDALQREYTVKNLRSFAGSKATPLKTLKLLLQHEDAEVHSKVLTNPNLTWVVLKPELEKLLAGVATKNITPSHNRWELRLILSKVKTIPDSFWVSMLNHSDSEVRGCAIHEAKNSKLLDKVILDCWEVKAAVAANVKTPAVVLSQLFDEVSENSPDMTLRVWDRLAPWFLAETDVYYAIASNKSTPETILVKIFEANMPKFIKATSVSKGVFLAQFRNTPNLLTSKYHSFTPPLQVNPSTTLPLGTLIVGLLKNPSLPSAVLKSYESLAVVKFELDSRAKKNGK